MAGEWDPVKELEGVQGRMNKLFESALLRTHVEAHGDAGGWSPVADFCESPERVTVWLELPGIDQKDIDLQIDEREMVIQGERRMDPDPSGEFQRVERSYGKFARRFPLPPGTDPERVEAVYEDGVLRVTLAKRSGDGGRRVRVPVR